MRARHYWFTLIVSLLALSVSTASPAPYQGASSSDSVQMSSYKVPGREDPIGLVVGNTWHDAQHFGSMGRMIDWGWDATNHLTVHFGWTDLPEAEFVGRSYTWSCYHTTGDSVGAEKNITPYYQYGGFVNLAVTNANAAMVGGHHNSGSGYAPQFFVDSCPPSGCLVKPGWSRVPDSLMRYANSAFKRTIWPRFRYQEVPGQQPVQHVVAVTEAVSEGDPLAVYYFRRSGDAWDAPWDYPPYVIDTSFTMAHDVVCSRSDGKVALIWTANLCPDLPGCDTCSNNVGGSQRNNDLYYQVSNDYGLTWQPRVNLTKNVDGVDGFRPYTDLSGIITSDDNLHIGWNGRVWPHDAIQGGEIGDNCHLFHWGENLGFGAEGRGVVTTAADLDWHQTTCDGGAGQMNAAKMSLAECNGKLYYLWSQFNDIHSGIDDDCARRAIDDTLFAGAANGELLLSVSDDYGFTWDQPRNLTNTYSSGCDSAGGVGGRCNSEMWASMAEVGTDYAAGPRAAEVDPSGEYTGDWFLDVQYLDDRDPGAAVLGEGTWQLADVRWFRLACVDPVPYAKLKLKTDLDTSLSIDAWQATDVPLDLANLGNSDLYFSFTIHNITGPPGWLGVSGLDGGSIGTFPANQIAATLHLNQGGLAGDSISTIPLAADVVFEGNFVSSPETLVVQAVVVPPFQDSWPDTVYATDGTGSRNLALVIANNGNLGQQGAGHVNLDYFDYGDCDIYDEQSEDDPFPGDASVYLYDASPVICWYDSTGDSVACNISVYGEDHLTGRAFIPIATYDTLPGWLPHPDPDPGLSSMAMVRGVAAITYDSGLLIDQVIVAPDDPDAQWMLKLLRVSSYDGLSHAGITVGDFIDWNIPSDSGTRNNSGYEADLHLVFQSGSEYDDDPECLENDDRFGGISVLAVCHSADHQNYHGMYAMDNATQMVPFGGVNNDSLQYHMSEQEGLTAADSSDADLHTTAAYATDVTIAPGSDFAAYSVLVTGKSGYSDFRGAVQDARQMAMMMLYQPAPDCCDIAADINHDGEGPDISDLVYLVTYMFQSGPPPPCLHQADVNFDGEGPDISDLVYLVTYMFQQGPPSQCYNGEFLCP